MMMMMMIVEDWINVMNNYTYDDSDDENDNYDIYENDCHDTGYDN